MKENIWIKKKRNNKYTLKYKITKKEREYAKREYT